MLSLKSREGAVKAEIPRDMYMAVVRLQAAESLDWEDACVRAAQLIDSNSEEFRRAVSREAQRLYKSRFMREVNRARESIRESAWNAGAEYVRESEDNFHVPCSICGKPMHFSSRDQNWEEEKRVLHDAFRNWHHTSCAIR